MKLIIDKLIITGIAWALTACSGISGEDDLPVPEDKGDPISIAFNMFETNMTRADNTTETDPMEVGNTFMIYVYDAQTKNATTGAFTPGFSGSPIASGVYTIGQNAQGKLEATGNLKLYRGTYYMYLVSYNLSSEHPEIKETNGQITVENGKDFMYTTLENIVVQPETAGGNSMTVKLPAPFKRLGSQVIVKAAAKNGGQPVTPSSLVVNEITINKLPASLDFQFGKLTWENCLGYNTSYTYPSDAFKRNDSSGNPSLDPIDYWTSDPAVLLPVDGTVPLEFRVNLTVTYSSGTKTSTKTYPASVQKVLLPGMTYEFTFTLTFYGELLPTDLTLAVKEYNTVTLESDGLGK